MTLPMTTYLPAHHPDEGVLMDFASGATHEAGAVLIATHLALCPQCRATVNELESLGGALIEDLPPSALAPHSRDRVMAQLDQPPEDSPTLPEAYGSHRTRLSRLPRPLQDYINAELDELSWQRLGPTVDQVELRLRGDTAAVRERMRLLRIKAGSAIPRHTHSGTEMVLVLSGGFHDRTRRFLRGDFDLSDQQVDHSPVADREEDCICLSVTDAPLRFTGLFGRILNLFVRF